MPQRFGIMVECASVEGILVDRIHVPDRVPKTFTSRVSDGLRDISHSRSQEHFPWNKLPVELRVKILQILSKSDLDKCRFLNRDTFELIRCNERSMRRRHFDTLVFGRGFRLRVVCFEEKIDQSLVVKKPKKLKCPPNLSDVFSSSINNCLPKVLKNADVQHLHFFMVPLTDALLSTISSCLLNAGSRVHTLSISQTSMAYVSSSMLLQFLRDVAPKAVDLYRIKCFHENLSSEVFQFIATRQHFSVDCFGPDPSPIDDDILSQLTASDFAIAAPNMITIDGLKSFVERVASGKQRVNRGMILANFHLEGIVFPSSPNLKIVTEGRVIKLSTEAAND